MPFGTSTMLYNLLAERIKFPICREKRSDTIYIKPITSYMCGITYFNTICVHHLKSAYSLFKMHTTEKDYVFNVPSSSRLAFIAAYMFLYVLKENPRMQ